MSTRVSTGHIDRVRILTGDRVGELCVPDVFGKNDGQTRFQVEVNMTVQEPRTRVISLLKETVRMSSVKQEKPDSP